MYELRQVSIMLTFPDLFDLPVVVHDVNSSWVCTRLIRVGGEEWFRKSTLCGVAMSSKSNTLAMNGMIRKHN